MRLSCGSESFARLPHHVGVDLIAGMGFDGHDVMLGAGRSEIPVPELRADVAGWAGRLEERIRGRGLEISDVFAVPWTGHEDAPFETMTPNHPDPAEVERSRDFFRDMIDLVVRMGCPGLTMLPGLHWEGETHEESLRRAAEELGRRAAWANERGVGFSFEPHIGSICRSPEDTARLCDLAPGLQITLDYSHFISRGFSEEEIEPLIPYARHVHVRGATPDRLQASLKNSTIGWERVIDAMVERGYDGYLSVEYINVDFAHLNEIDVVSETVMLRDRLRAKLAGEEWSMPASHTKGPSERS